MALGTYHKFNEQFNPGHRFQDADMYDTTKSRQKQVEPFKQTISPLLQMQKNYQKKLLEEKEKKLAELYRNHQESSMREISKKSSKQVKQYFKRANSDIQRDAVASGKSDRGKRLPPIDRQAKKTQSFHEQNFTSHTNPAPVKQKSKPLVISEYNGLEQKRQAKKELGNEKENTDSSIPDLASLKALKRIQAKKQQQLQKLNKRHQDQVSPQQEIGSRKKNLTDFQKWQIEQDMERQVRLNRHNHQRDEDTWLDVSPDVSTTEIDCEPFAMKPKLHQSDAFQKHTYPNNSVNKITKKPKPNRLELLRQRIAPDKEEPTFGSSIRANDHQNQTTNHNIRLDSTYSKQSGLSEQMKVYQNNYKVKEYRQNDMMAGFQKPVLVRRDTRSTTSSRTSTRNTFSPQVNPINPGINGDRYKQNWKGENKTQETVHHTDRLVIHEKPGSQEEINEYEAIDLVACNICGRKFKKERLTQHSQVCSKTAGKKRKVFNMANARKKGTDLDGFTAVKGTTKRVAPPKSNWKSKHEDFINTIRHAKQVSAYVAEGGKITDLPPPPPSLNPDYVQCQYCERKFAPQVAERHIPKCKETKSRPPPPKKRQPNRRR